MSAARTICFLALVVAGLSLPRAEANEPAIRVEKHAGGVRVFCGDDLFTDYRIDLGPKPILWPIRNAAGVEMTRAFPMEKRDGEKQDHPHHRSLWFTFGAVNGVDFWTEAPGNGVTRHRSFGKVEVAEGSPLIVTSNDWLRPDGSKVCEDVRTLRFGEEDGARWIDFDIRLIASEGDVKLGDTKEGMLGLRVPTWMDVNGKNNSRILNSEGLKDAAAWGKRARWVDYRGVLNGASHGVAIFEAPAGFRHPTYWHVRTYGLFAANPFGVHDFTGENSGEFTLEKEKEINFSYRVMVYSGEPTTAEIDQRYARFANLAK